MTLDARAIHKLYEGLVTHFYESELAEGSCFIDIGANVGHHTWRMATEVGASGNGFAIEPVPALAERVRGVLKNKSLDSVELVEVALSDAEGSAEFFFRPSHIGWSSLYEDHVHPADSEDDRELINVDVRRLDDILLERVESVDFMKLDIEHSEFRAMLGGRKLIEKHRPVLVFENAPLAAARISGYPIEDFFSFFEEINYTLLDIFLDPFGPTDIAEKRPKDLPSYYVGLPNEHPATPDPKSFYGIADAISRLSE